MEFFVEMVQMVQTVDMAQTVETVVGTLDWIIIILGTYAVAF